MAAPSDRDPPAGQDKPPRPGAGEFYRLFDNLETLAGSPAEEFAGDEDEEDDNEAEGTVIDEVTAVVTTTTKSGATTTKPRRPRPKVSELTKEWHLWCDPGEENCYASVPDDRGTLHWPIDSKYVRRRLVTLHCKAADDRPPQNGWLRDAIQYLEAKAVSDGRRHEPRRRVCQAAGCIFVDMADDARRVVKIEAEGPVVTTIGEIAKLYGVYFIRASRMRAMPLFDLHDTKSIDELVKEIIKFPDDAADDSCTLFIGALVGAFMGKPPYFILGISGEQGAGKTFATETYKLLSDPGLPMMTPMPGDDERRLMLALHNSHVVAFDNASSMPALMSDLLCSATSGTGMAFKKNYADLEEIVYSGGNPIALNGIPNVGERADFNDRTLRCTVEPIPDEDRETHAELVATRERLLPFILGAIFDAVSAALRNRASMKLKSFSRLADLEQFMARAEPGLGWEEGRFTAALARNRESSAAASFESDIVAQAVFKFATELKNREVKGRWWNDRWEWKGTATELLLLLNDDASDATRNDKYWPKKAGPLGAAVVRAAPLLRKKKVEVNHKRSRDRDLIIWEKTP